MKPCSWGAVALAAAGFLMRASRLLQTRSRNLDEKGGTMSLISIVAVAIVLGGVVLIAAAGFTISAEEPPASAGETAVAVKLWCPVAREETRVGIGADAAGPGLTLVWCDRLPAGPVGCDRACLPIKAAA
jgi:hypothetical protein